MSEETINVTEVKKHLSELIERAHNGEEIVISQAGRTVARLLPILEENGALRVPGNDKGRIIIKPDFDDPLDKFEY